MIVQDINNIPKLQTDMDKILDRVATKLGQYLEAKLVEKITEQDASWSPLHPFTVEQKKSTKAWIDKGELQGLITHHIEGTMPKVIEVGIFNHEKGYIALILEYGADIHVTDKMRRYLGSQGLHIRANTTEIHIPERPLFRLVFDMDKNNIENLIEDELAKEINKYLF